MNRIKMMFVVALMGASTLYAQHEPLRRMAVVSDVHLMSPSLLEKGGAAFDSYIADDRKMLVESQELLDTVTGGLAAFRPQVVLITGDLTKDGERVSHELLVERYLKPLKAQGVRVLVIPGNHDVNNPHAKIYDGDSCRRTASVSAGEFAAIYSDFGYGDALATDPYSLSYVAQLDPTTRIIAVDACRYDDNDFDKDLCVTAGRIKPQTLDFIETETRKAHAEGMEVVMMMHHGIVSHFKWQDKVMGDYLVSDWRKMAKRMAKLGIRVCFTGHFHAQDIASRYGFVDIETGSTVSYPHPYRLISVDTDRCTFDIHTQRVAALGSMCGGSETLQQKSARFANSALSGVMETMVPKKVPAAVKTECARVLGEAYAMHLAGDECPPADFRLRLKTAIGHLRRHSWKWAFIMGKIGKYLSTDTGVADNDVVISYKNGK